MTVLMMLQRFGQGGLDEEGTFDLPPRVISPCSLRQEMRNEAILPYKRRAIATDITCLHVPCAK